MIKWAFLLVFSCPFVFNSCSDSPGPAEQIRLLNQSDTFLSEWNKPRYMNDSEYLVKKQEFYSYNKIEPLYQGFDSVQIRIYYGGPMVRERLIILKNENHIWSAMVSRDVDEIKPGIRDTTGLTYWDFHIRNRYFDNKTPESGWENFISKLFRQHLLTLPDEGRITGFVEESVMDGAGVWVEIATKNVYRNYRYGNPEIYKDKFAEAKSICQILNILDSEFDLKPLWGYSTKKTNKSPGKQIRVEPHPIEIKKLY